MIADLLKLKMLLEGHLYVPVSLKDSEFLLTRIRTWKLGLEARAGFQLEAGFQVTFPSGTAGMAVTFTKSKAPVGV